MPRKPEPQEALSGKIDALTQQISEVNEKLTALAGTTLKTDVAMHLLQQVIDIVTVRIKPPMDRHFVVLRRLKWI